MTEFLAIDWDDQHATCLSASAAAKSVRIHRALTWEWAPDEIPSEHPEAAGRRLRAELDKAGVAAAPVLISLPREETVVRLLELPEADDNDLPDLVRLQAATRSSTPLDRLLLDYLPLPRLPNVTGRRVMMATVAKPKIERIEAILAAAHLQAAGTRLSSVGIAEFAAHHRTASKPVEPNALTMIVSREGTRLEIVATWKHQIVLTYAGRLSAHEETTAEMMLQQLLNETSRASVAMGQAAPGLRVGGGWVLGRDEEIAGIASALEERFAAHFQALAQPLDARGLIVESDAEVSRTPGGAACAGLLMGQALQTVESIDFMHPRKKVVQPDRRRLRQALAGAAAAMLLLAGYVGIRMHVSKLDDQIAAIRADHKTRQATVDKAKPLVESARALDEWTSRDIDWIKQIRELAASMGGTTDKLYLSSLETNVASRGTLATIIAQGRAKSRNDVNALNQKLVDRGYKLRPREILTDPADPVYPEKFELNLEMPVAQPAKAPDAKPAVATPEVPAPTTKAASNPKSDGGAG